MRACDTFRRLKRNRLRGSRKERPLPVTPVIGMPMSPIQRGDDDALPLAPSLRRLGGSRRSEVVS
jgi:hypothetical protein